MQSNSSNGQLTAQISMSDHKKSGFDLSNNVLGTGKIGRIIPTRALHVMPGDTIKQDSKVAVQFEPLAVPILANMDVRQEHFYVPYNIVWKNWDKFISGGEKMDYKGIVPNVSMIRIVEAVLNQFNNAPYPTCSINLPLLVSPKSQSGEQIATLNGDYYADDTYFIQMRENIKFIGEKYVIKDLLNYMNEVLDLIREKYVGTWSNTTPMPLMVNFTDKQDMLLYVDDNKINFSSKYHEILMPVYQQLADDGLVTVVTDYGVEWLLLLYELVKPLFGLGSNIDYLNMGRISPTDFIYVMSRIASSIIAMNTGTQSDEKLVTLSSKTYFSQQPLSVLHLRANYNIWYNNYRDILLEANAFEPVDSDSVNLEELFVLLVPRQRCWEKDAFTTALDTPGTGNAVVPVSNQGTHDSLTMKWTDVVGQASAEAIKNDQTIYEVRFSADEVFKIPTSYLTGMLDSSSDKTNTTVNYFSLSMLDAAQRAQKWLQKALFFGNRISDFYYMHFGVRFLDARLRLPELLTSSKELVKLDVVMNNTNITTEANGEVYQSVAGDRAAYASAYDNGNSFDRFCEEHGVVMSYLTIMPQITYAYGSSRDYSRLDQFDFAFSEFATLGMDAVYDSEITNINVNLPNGSQDIKVFGYQGKYYDYKAKHSEEHGELLDSQDMYTFARFFNMYDPEGRPKLNYEFVHCFPSLDMFVVDSQLADYFRYDIRHSTAAERNLPSQSIYI